MCVLKYINLLKFNFVTASGARVRPKQGDHRKRPKRPDRILQVRGVSRRAAFPHGHQNETHIRYRFVK